MLYYYCTRTKIYTIIFNVVYIIIIIIIFVVTTLILLLIQKFVSVTEFLYRSGFVEIGCQFGNKCIYSQHISLASAVTELTSFAEHAELLTVNWAFDASNSVIEKLLSNIVDLLLPCMKW